MVGRGVRTLDAHAVNMQMHWGSFIKKPTEFFHLKPGDGAAAPFIFKGLQLGSSKGTQ